MGRTKSVPSHSLIRGAAGQAGLYSTTTFQSETGAKRRASVHHLRHRAREEEAQLLRSLPDALFAELSCASSLDFLLRRGEEGKRKQAFHLHHLHTVRG